MITQINYKPDTQVIRSKEVTPFKDSMLDKLNEGAPAHIIYVKS